MINALIKWGLIASLWRRYGRILKGLFVVIVLLFAIGEIHDDVVRYAQVSHDEAILPVSYVAKWGLIAVTLFIYWSYIRRVLASQSRADQTLKMSPSKNKRDAFAGEAESEHSVAGGALEQLRHKEHLLTRAQWLIQNKPTRSKSGE